MVQSGFSPRKGEKNKQVDISVWTEARRQEILCNVTVSTSKLY